MKLNVSLVICILWFGDLGLGLDENVYVVIWMKTSISMLMSRFHFTDNIDDNIDIEDVMGNYGY